MNLPTLIEDMPMREYLADPAPDPSITAGTVKRLTETAPGKVWLNNARLNPEYEEETATRFDLGTAAHSLFVGAGEETRHRRPGLPDEGGEGSAGPACQQRHGATRPSCRTMDARPRGRGGAGAVRGKPGIRRPDPGHEARGDHAVARGRGDLQVTSGLLHRTDRETVVPIIVHYKTTAITLSKRALERFAAASGWDHTAEHYGAGVMALTGHEPEQYFAVQEVTPPYLCMAVRLGRGVHHRGACGTEGGAAHMGALPAGRGVARPSGRDGAA